MSQFLNEQSLNQDFNFSENYLYSRNKCNNEPSPYNSDSRTKNQTYITEPLYKTTPAFSSDNNQNQNLNYNTKLKTNIILNRNKSTNCILHHPPLYSSSSPYPIKINKTYYYNNNDDDIKNLNNINYTNISNNNYNLNCYERNCTDIKKNNKSYIKKKLDDNKNEIKKNWRQINHLNALAFDDCMSKLAFNKYNKIKEYNSSYYLRKLFCGPEMEDYENGFGINSLKGKKNLDDLKLMRKKLDEKQQVYSRITKYDDLYSINNIEDYNNKENIGNTSNSNNNVYYKDSKNSKKHKNKNKCKLQKKYKYNKFNKNNKNNLNNNTSSDSDSNEIIINNNNNKIYPSNKNKIQRTFNENIGINNNANIFSIYKHYKKKVAGKNDDNSIINTLALLDYIKKENEDIKKINQIYKQLLDTILYFLNNLSHKYSKLDFNRENDELKYNLIPPKLFDISNNNINIDDFSKKLHYLEKNIEEYINKKIYIIINNKNKLLSITKENSFFLPEWSRIVQFNNLIENLNEKCFSFKNKDENNIKNIINKDNNNNIKNKLNREDIDKIKNNKENISSNYLLGCNINKKGNMPIRNTNNFNKNVNIYNNNNKRNNEKKNNHKRFNSSIK